MRCAYHADNNPVGGCVNCGKLICVECKATIAGNIYCNPCVEEMYARGFMQTTATRARAQYAGFWRRFFAALIDGILLCIIFAGIYIGCISLGLFVTESDYWGGVTGSWVAVILTLLLSWNYYAAMESSFKQATLGKIALGIVVTDLEGRRISFRKATGRYFGKIASAIILLIGFIMVAFTERKQGLHDMMAECLVVKKGDVLTEVSAKGQ